MSGEKHWRIVLVRDDRWAGTTTRLADDLTPGDSPPESLVVRIRELRTTAAGGEPLGLEQREREVLCARVGELGRTAFYIPTPEQHAADEPWPTAARTIVTVWPDPSSPT